MSNLEPDLTSPYLTSPYLTTCLTLLLAFPYYLPLQVPRDMSYPAARMMRAHLNSVIEAVGKQAAAEAA